MRSAALAALIVGIVLQATRVRPLRVENLSRATHSEVTPFEEREDPDDEFEVRLTPDEVKAASGEALSHDRKARCPIMQLGAGAARGFYYKDPDDGLGSRILYIIGALSYAEKMNLSLAGLTLHPRRPQTSHYVNIPLAMKWFFGCADVSDMYLFVRDAPGAQRFTTIDDLTLQLKAGEMEPGVPVYVEEARDLADQEASPTILAALRFFNTPIMQMPLARFHPSDFNVAVHVRRGDVEPLVRARGTSAEYYLWLLKIMRSKMPRAKFHVFSETGKRRDYSKEFDQYRGLGAIVHLDTEARETLAHMARADVLVTAHSSFSYVAALFNPNCVLDQGWKAPQRGWVELPKKQPEDRHRVFSISQKIGSCMDEQRGKKSAQH